MSTVTQTEIKRVFHLGNVRYEGNARKMRGAQFEIRIEYKQAHNGQRDTDLQAVEGGYYTVALTGTVWDARRNDALECGQNLHRILEYVRNTPGISPTVNDKATNIVGMWNKFHLNDIQAGTRVQNSALDAFKTIPVLAKSLKVNHYARACELLDSIDLLTDRGYKYGAAWLVQRVPADALECIAGLFGISKSDLDALRG